VAQSREEEHATTLKMGLGQTCDACRAAKSDEVPSRLQFLFAPEAEAEGGGGEAAGGGGGGGGSAAAAGGARKARSLNSSRGGPCCVAKEAASSAARALTWPGLARAAARDGVACTASRAACVFVGVAAPPLLKW
jgi:hypothetical protein